MENEFSADFGLPSTPFPHFWEHTVGSGHAALALRADWQQQMRRVHDELGMRRVRFHGMLSDHMGTLVVEDNRLIYSLFNADQVMDFLLSIGMAPFVELSFMPVALASGKKTVFSYKDNVTLPKDYDAWGKLIHTVVSHWFDRYGIGKMEAWFFEVWNEPNLTAFWTGTQGEYFELYKHAALAIKAVHPGLQVGGPATASNAWISAFRKYCEKNAVPYDFISTHHYPTDAFGKPGDDTVTQLAASRRSVLREQAAATREKAGLTPVYYTEWSTSSNPFDRLHDCPYAAAYIVKTVMEAQGLVDGYSYWTFSDIFDENYFSSVPFHGGFGLLNIYGIPKPAYRAYQILHRLGDRALPVYGNHPTVDVWAFAGHMVAQILLTNSALPRHPVKQETIRIRLQDFAGVKNAWIERIDDRHANGTAAWEAMGCPGTLSHAQVRKLELASALVIEAQGFLVEEDATILEVELPAQGTALITIATP